MDQPIKPIKRSKELVPLSKEHHDGLLAVWKIKQGLRNGTDHKIIAEFIQWFWENDLQEHFKKEETILSVHLPGENELVQQMFKEHEEIEALININAMIADEDIFAQVTEQLQNHIRFEERVLFPFAEKVIPSDTMEDIYQALLLSKPKSKWENEFWLTKK
jgi:hemerythrin-like domain-containing protein